jgi:dihydroneopterin aldolase
MDTLKISGLSVATQIGVHTWEQRISQPLLLDISMSFDCSQCEDELSNTIDYDSLCSKVTEFIESNAFKLIETVANQVAALIKKEFNVEQVTVSVSKPHAIKNAASAQVTVQR